jgi:hypothetical protein
MRHTSLKRKMETKARKWKLWNECKLLYTQAPRGLRSVQTKMTVARMSWPISDTKSEVHSTVVILAGYSECP